MREETKKRLRRLRARRRMETDPMARASFDALAERLRDLIGAEAHEAHADMLADAMVLALDLEPPRSVRLHHGNPYVPLSQRDLTVRFAVRTYPVAAGDWSMSQEDMELKYSFLHVLSWLRAGITPKELGELGLSEAWETIAAWVDGVRGGDVE